MRGIEEASCTSTADTVDAGGGCVRLADTSNKPFLLHTLLPTQILCELPLRNILLRAHLAFHPPLVRTLLFGDLGRWGDPAHFAVWVDDWCGLGDGGCERGVGG
jgi:hypothetical protein